MSARYFLKKAYRHGIIAALVFSRPYYTGVPMRKALVSVLFPLFLLLSGCGADAEKTYLLTLDFTFDAQEATDCTSYLADKFAVTVYDDAFDVRTVKSFPCAKEPSPAAVDLPAGTYYLTVALQDANGNIKSWGSAQTLLAKDGTLAVAMRQYRGGITLQWGQTLCDDLGIGLFTVTATRDGDPVSAVVWGAEKEVTDLAILCNAKKFAIQNIEAGSYTLSVQGFRSADSDRPRAGSDIPPFIVTAGQDSAVPLGEHLTLTVSDLAVLWEFDSKSIASCADAGVAEVRATAVPTAGEAFTQTAACDLAGKRTFYFYDLPAEDYTVTVDGLDAGGEATYTGHKVLTIEPGKVGKNGYTVDIFIKQE